MRLDWGVGQGVQGWGRGGVQELDLKEGLALTCTLFHCPQTPLTNSEESLDFSVSLEQVQA